MSAVDILVYLAMFWFAGIVVLYVAGMFLHGVWEWLHRMPRRLEQVRWQMDLMRKRWGG